MKIKRLLRFFKKIRFFLIIDGEKRAEFLKKNKLLRGIGDNCLYQSRKFPMDPEMLLIHDNVTIAADVTFVTHDAIRHVLMYSDKEYYAPNLGCIEVKSNVFIGLGSIIMPNVTIGENVIVAAGSLVTKDVPSGVIVGGVPAKIIGSFDKLKEERKNITKMYKNYSDKELKNHLWENFIRDREKRYDD